MQTPWENISTTAKKASENKDQTTLQKEMDEERKLYGVSMLRINPAGRPWEENNRTDAEFSNEFWDKFDQEMTDDLSGKILTSIGQDSRSQEILVNDKDHLNNLNFIVKNLAEAEVKNILSDVLRLPEKTGTLVNFIKDGAMPLTQDHLYENIKKDILIREKLITQGITDTFNNQNSYGFYFVNKNLQSFINNGTPGLLDKPDRQKNLPYYASLYLKGQAVAYCSKLIYGVNSPAFGEVLDKMTDLISGRYNLLSGQESEEFKKGASSDDFDKWIVTRTKIQNQMDRMLGSSSYATIHRGEIDKYLTSQETGYNLTY